MIGETKDMDYLFGMIYKENSEIKCDDNVKYTYTNEQLKFTIQCENNSQCYLKSENIIIGMLGEVYDAQSDELEHIYEKYRSSGIEHIQAMNGFYTVIIIDLNINKLYIVQDCRTSFEHLYFCENNGVLYFSTSLKWLLDTSKIKREVNTEILPTYLHYSFTPSKETLIKNVYKLPSYTCLEYNLNNREYSLVKNLPHITRDSHHKELIDIIDEAIEKRMERPKKTGFSLSGGFDSNLLFSRAVNFLEDSNINVFSYGYNNPKSELKNVERIIELYKNKGYKISHYKYNAKAEDISKLPQIIEFLQEPILEPGLIFHYSMADMMKENGIEVLFGGDCNDQVYDKRLYYDMISKVQEPLNLENYPVYGRLRLGEFDRIHTYKYFTDIETEWILKSDIFFESLNIRLEVYSDVFTNYFMLKRFFVRKNNVSVRLPFLDLDYTHYIQNNIEIPALPFKKNHIDLCEKYIPQDIYKELINATEASSPYSYLFLEDDAIRNKIFLLIMQSDTMKMFFNEKSINQLLNSLDISMLKGRETGNYYKASILSCRIFAILGFLVWYNIYIAEKDSSNNIFEILAN